MSTGPAFQHLHLGAHELLDQKLLRLTGRSGVTAVRGGTVFGPDGRMTRSTVVIDGMRIRRIVPHDAPDGVEAGARIVDASGAWVIPGLMDAHIHFMGKETTDPHREYFGTSEDYRFIRAAFEVYQTLASGVTTVRALGHGPAEHCYALRSAIREGLVRGPRIFTSGWALSQTRGHGDVPGLPYDWVEHERPRSAFCDGELECRKLVRRNFGEGADVIKVYTSDNRTGRPDFTVAELEAIVDEAHRRGKRVATHAKTYDGVRNALLAGIDTIEHGPPEVFPDLIDMMVERSAFLVPTMATVHRVAYEGDDWGVPQAARDRARRELEGRQKAVRAAAERGVRVVTGSDAGARAGFGVLSTRELELVVDSGLSETAAIHAATSVAAEALGIAQDVGTIEPGKLADLLLVDVDPLSDIRALQDRTNLRAVLQAEDGLTE